MRWRRLERLAGGEIHEVWKVDTDDGVAVLKQSRTPLVGVFAAEADGLARLRAADAIRVPEVWDIGDDWLLLEYLRPTPITDEANFARRLAEGLAALHQIRGDAFGLEIDNWIGRLPQENAPCARWSDFLRGRRLHPQIAHARAAGNLPPYRERLLEAVVGIADDLLAGFDEPPALLHGDLWEGNLLCVDGEPALLDPAVYYGSREMEIVYMECFGGRLEEFVPVYRAVYPLDDGYEARRPLHMLYPLLFHLNHFGDPFGAQVDQVCRDLLGRQG